MTILTAQCVYLALAIGYNAISLVLKRHDGRALAPTDIRAASIMFGLYAAVLLAGALGWELFYRAAIAVFAAFLGFTGVVVHVRRGPTNQYRSPGTWLSAILINAFGAVANIAGVAFGP